MSNAAMGEGVDAAEGSAVAAESQVEDPRREQSDGEGRRRSRDRYGRDRRERGGERGERAPHEEGAHASSQPQGEATRTDPINYVAEPAATPPSRHGEPVRSTPPKVQPYDLPISDLKQVAEGSGLQWVNSDAEKIAAVRAAIAAEPKPVHVPRERPPEVVIDEGPLVLVETRKDLGNLQLPF